MRLSQPIEFKRIEQALLKGACPFCLYLKSYQSAHLRDVRAVDIEELCNFHAWALAAAVDKSTVAAVFRKLLERDRMGLRHCSICTSIHSEEKRQLLCFAEGLSGDPIKAWISAHGTFCIEHAIRLSEHVPEAHREVVKAVVRRTARELVEGLNRLRDDDPHQQPGAGVLGRAAEFLVSQRGLSR